MKTWLLGSLSILSSVLVASACVLVEDFKGYGPIGDETCDEPPCPSASSGISSSSSGGSSGVGGMGGAGSSSGSSSGSGGSAGNAACSKIPCNGSPCMPELLVPNSQNGLIAVDSDSLFIATNGPSHMERIAKPGCIVPPFDQLVDYPFADQGFVSDGQYAAWIKVDVASSCLSPALVFCDLANCKGQEIPIPSTFTDQGSFSRIALGPGYLYFTMRNGLVGRVPKGSTQLEQLWIDPINQLGPPKRGDLIYPGVSDGKLFVVRQFIEDAMADVCSGVPAATSGTIWTSDLAADATPQSLAQNLNYPSALAMSQSYVYFHVTDFAAVLHRVPKTGGLVETLPTNGTLSAAYGPIFVSKGWVYFRVGLPNNMQGIVRLSADSGKFSPDSAEIVVESPFFRNFHVDDDAVYWDDCADPPGCNSFRILARVMAP